MPLPFQTIKRKFQLDDTFSIEMERDLNERRIFLVNEPLQVYRLMATYTIDAHWVFPNSSIADEFLRLAVKFPSIKYNIHKDMLFPYEIGAGRMFNCLKRKWHIKIVRTGYKIKHIID